MKLSREASGPVLSARDYRLVFRADRPFVTVEDTAGRVIAELFVFTGVHSMAGQDETCCNGEWSVVEEADAACISIVADSTQWASKRIVFRCEPHRFSYHTEVEGVGQLADVQYFGGYYS